MEILIQWKDGSTKQEIMKDAKECYPLHLSEYYYQTKTTQEPVFEWWAPQMRKKSNQIISKVKSKYCICTQKFGVRIPNSVKEAIKLDKSNGNTL